MKRLRYLAVLVVLSSSASTAQAGDFVIGGHRIHVEARRGCRSLSCVSWSDLGRNRRDRDEDAAPVKPALAVPASAPTQQAQPVQQPLQQPQVEPPAPQPQPAPQVQVAPPPAPPKTSDRNIELASTTTQSTAPPAPKVEARITVLPAPVVTPPSVPQQAASTKAKHEKAKDEKIKDDRVKNEETAADTPLGDWRTEGKKGLVRIEQCGKELCGYVLNASTNAKGETVLSNMKSKSANKWTGDIFSRASGNTYYAKMTLKAPNTLHVEACAVLRFFCSGNDWTRVVGQGDEMIISRQGANAPNS
jgi:uncharacterized protein (DUF2147 family)